MIQAQVIIIDKTMPEFNYYNPAVCRLRKIDRKRKCSDIPGSRKVIIWNSAVD